MHSLFMALSACLMLGGCATISEVAGASIPAQAAYVAVNSFDTLEAAATLYLTLPTCGAAARTVCKELPTARKIIVAVHTGRSARDEVETLLEASHGEAIPVASYATLKAAMNVLQGVSSIAPATPVK